MEGEKQLRVLSDKVADCRKCARLVNYREMVAREKRRMFRDCTYWGRGVPGFGDFSASLLILGLAPAAHGANRTGRMFTGDRSGDFCIGPSSGGCQSIGFSGSGDGLLKNAYIAAATVRSTREQTFAFPKSERQTRHIAAQSGSGLGTARMHTWTS